MLLISIIAFLAKSCNKNQVVPKIGEVYVITLDNQLFTTWKIAKVGKSEIWYVQNDYNVSEKNMTDAINLEKNYTDAPKSIDRDAFIKKKPKYLIEIPEK